MPCVILCFQIRHSKERRHNQRTDELHVGRFQPEPQHNGNNNKIQHRADDRSITAGEADEEVKTILAALETELGAVLR